MAEQNGGFPRPGKSESSRITSVLHDGRGGQLIFTIPVNKEKQEVEVDWKKKKKWISPGKERGEEYDEYLGEFD